MPVTCGYPIRSVKSGLSRSITSEPLCPDYDRPTENDMPRTRGSGSIYKQKGSAAYWVKYYRHGKPFRESTKKTNKGEAKEFLKQRLAEIATGNFYGPV